MSKQKHKQITCVCSAYKFPHRFGGGKCSITSYVQRQFYPNHPVCKTCNCFRTETKTCDVIEQLESYKYCEFIQDLQRNTEIKL